MLAVALLALAAVCQQEKSRPNVLVLVADDISERDMDVLETPAFDSLAACGLRFRRAYASPTCSPSRRALQFGTYFARDAGPVCNGYLAETAPSTSRLSLPRLFSDAGYRTALFGKWHLGSYPGVLEGEPWQDTPRLHGYDTWRAGIPVNVDLCGGKDYRSWLRVDDGSAALSQEYVPDAIRDAFLAWFEEREGEAQPWFAMVCFQMPHAPLHDVPGSPERKNVWPRTQFESMVRYHDTIVGELLSAIDLERTLVVYVADNGTSPGVPSKRQSRKKMKTTTFEDGIRVPMVWAGAGVPVGMETETLVHFVDLLPTLAELLGRSVESDELDGSSLLPLARLNERAVHEYVWSGLLNPTGGDYAVVTSRYKLRLVDGKTHQLFDLMLDPEETKNLVELEEHADLVADLKLKLQRHVRP